ncbi:IS3 family transposase [Thermodesulfobacterium thermophilum]|uniref:IS3 family transposase n=1 Tax=Thermodesulfobacterium thermophilum TaxID=886 RepID=UPI0003B3CDBB|nr:IS3 family transposase [Thermodesulfobacterium thermophilum]
MLILQAHAHFNVPIVVLCRRFNLPRASFYRSFSKKGQEVVEKIRHLALSNPSWGYRRIWAELRKHKQGIKVNHKRVYRLYKLEALKKTCYSFWEEAL